MFWGVTLESGKRYSQKVSESYHLSMASLETLQGDTKPVKREVSVMIEHANSEYVLCTLEYGRVMQVNLDIIFDCGEVVTYFLSGEGTVHLTGYALAEADDDGADNVEKPNEVSALILDDEEEEDEDWTPSKEEKTLNSDESEESDEDSDSDELENEETATVKDNKSRKRKFSDSSPTQNGNARGDSLKFKKQQKMEANHMDAEDSNDDNVNEGEDSDDEDDDSDAIEEDESSIEYSSEEEHNTSAGRTPMPKKKVNSITSLGESPDLQKSPQISKKKQKTKLNTSNVSSKNKGTTPVTPKNARKLSGNVQVEDLRIGNGPIAKNGKFVFLHYIGKLANGKVFETCEFPKKPFSFRLGRGEVIKGLEVGMEGMMVGGKRRITIPPNMGYGNKTNDEIPANSTLTFVVDLKAVN